MFLEVKSHGFDFSNRINCRCSWTVGMCVREMSNIFWVHSLNRRKSYLDAFIYLHLITTRKIHNQTLEKPHPSKNRQNLSFLVIYQQSKRWLFGILRKDLRYSRFSCLFLLSADIVILNQHAILSTNIGSWFNHLSILYIVSKNL